RRNQQLSEIHRQATSVPRPNLSGVHAPTWGVEESTGVLVAPRAIMQLFPWDYRLPTLALALDPHKVAEELGNVDLKGRKVAGYWPGKRCQIKYYGRGETEALYGKVFPDGAGPTVGLSPGMIARRVPASEALVAPRVRAYVRAINLLVTEPVVDRVPLVQILNDPNCTDVVARVGHALGLFQSIPVAEIEVVFGPAEDMLVVQSWVMLTAGLFPDLSAELFDLLTGLQRTMPSERDEGIGLVHRDFYDRQLLITPRAVAVLDMDTAAQGDGEIDVANFCSHLILRQAQGQSSAEDTERLTTAFVEAYRRVRPGVDRHRLDWYLSTALVRLACVHALRVQWRHIVPFLLDEARRVLPGPRAMAFRAPPAAAETATARAPHPPRRAAAAPRRSG